MRVEIYCSVDNIPHTYIYIICYIAKLLNYFYISYNFSKRMFVQKIIYIRTLFMTVYMYIYRLG